MTRPASSRDETPTYIRVGDDDLFGILTRPTAAPNGTTALLAWGAALDPSSGRNQLRTRLARRLAAVGHHVMRLDYRGVGESSGIRPPVRLDQPPADDLRAVYRWLHHQGLTRVVLVGSCLGSRAALAISPEVEELVGVALLLCPVRDDDHFQTALRAKRLSWFAKRLVRPGMLKRLADPATRKAYSRWVSAKVWGMARARLAGLLPGSPASEASASPSFLRTVKQLVDGHVPLLFVYASGDPFYRDFQQALNGTLGQLLTKAGDLATVRVIDTRTYLYASTTAQDEVTEVISLWLSEVAGRKRSPSPRSQRVLTPPGRL